MTKDEALRMALEALKNAYWPTESDLMPAHNIKECGEAITAVKEALAQPEQEPFCYVNVNAQGDVTRTVKRKDAWCRTPLYTTPPQRIWVGLTDEDKQIAFDDTQEGGGFWEFADAIEAKLKEKNT